jgi:RHS repeat-associated protein
MVALNKTYLKTLTPDGSAKDSGYRFYSPEISRWLNRDPIGEKGGLNLYVFVEDGPAGKWDYLGVAAVPLPGPAAWAACLSAELTGRLSDHVERWLDRSRVCTALRYVCASSGAGQTCEEAAEWLRVYQLTGRRGWGRAIGDLAVCLSGINPLPATANVSGNVSVGARDFGYVCNDRRRHVVVMVRYSIRIDITEGETVVQTHAIPTRRVFVTCRGRGGETYRQCCCP